MVERVTPKAGLEQINDALLLCNYTELKNRKELL
jgi:hypothetical protein